MTQAVEHYARISELFQAVAELSAPARALYLERECGADDLLRREIDALLEADAQAIGFIEKPIAMIPGDLLAEGDFAGREFGAYRVIREIGRGGIGAVYSAARADEQFKKQVAIKVVKRGLDTDDILRRFRAERQILAQLDHPNIARLIDAGSTEEGLPYFVMEHVDGEPIGSFCETRQLSTGERVELFRLVCGAVTYAHQHLVIHRDIKPSNILVTADGVPKLLDFGIAKVLHADDPLAALTMTGVRVMTPEYASPEQVRGLAITTSSDIYSLGLLLYELLTGRKPYRLTTQTPEELSQAVLEQTPERPSTILRSASFQLAGSRDLERRATSLRGDLDNIVLMALRKEPERRYSSVAQFSGDLLRHLEGLPVLAHKDTVSYRASKFIRRNRLAVSAASLVVLAVLIGLFVSLWQAENARRQRDLAQRERQTAERMNLFLRRMLSFSNQSVSSVWPVTQKRNVTVNEMLDRVVPQVESELAEEPSVRAQLLRTIGSAYASQGRYESAEKSLRASLETRMQLAGQEDTESAATMTELGILSFRQAKLEEANQLLEKAVAFYREKRDANSPEYRPASFALALDYLGTVKYYRGEVNAPRTLMREALQISSGANLQGSERRITTHNKSDLGLLLVVTGDVDEGEPLLQEAAAEYRQIVPQAPWEFGSTLRGLGLVALQKNRPEEAEKHLLESAQVLRRTLGDQNSYLALTLDRHAAALLLKNDLAGAEEKARAALEIAQSISPENKLPWAGPLWTLGEILTRGGRLTEGEDCYQQALAIHEVRTKKNYLFLATSKVRFSQFLLAQNRGPEAERFAFEAHREAVDHLGGASPTARAARDNLIQVYAAQGKNDLAQGLK